MFGYPRVLRVTLMGGALPSYTASSSFPFSFLVRARSRSVEPWTSPSPVNKPSSELKQFEESKLGVKGLVNSDLTYIPPLFVHPPETLSSIKPAQPTSLLIPTIDLSSCESGRWPFIVEEVGRAARELGFFQIVNHGVPTEVMDRTITAMKAFNEQSMEAKAKIYRREFETGEVLLQRWLVPLQSG